MRYWFRGKPGGLVAFLIVTILVVGGLGWMTVMTLRMEQDQIRTHREHLEARAEADLARKLRLALWRLDTRISTELMKEANRPFSHYTSRPVARSSAKTPGVIVLELLPIPGTETNGWIPGNMVCAPAGDWKTPQALREMLIRRLGIDTNGQAKESAPDKGNEVINSLSSEATLNKLLDKIHAAEQQALVPGSPQADGAPSFNNDAYNPALAANAVTMQSAPAQVGQAVMPNAMNQLSQDQQQRVDRDTALRNQVQRDRNLRGSQFPVQQDFNESNRSNREALMVLGQMTPLWLTDPPQDRLVVARLVQIGTKPACQVTVLDWPALQEVLADEVRDLFPEARFHPIREGNTPQLELSMTALPVELEPGPMAASGAEVDNAEVSGTPLRIGLGLAWAASVVALMAVGLVGWSLLDLSERRIRFVSAVTHELRTPMTTLRLYLDMLTGGLVQDDKQKEEYLHTLNAETDRLNRLIGNVLDFSRLENQRPRLNRTAIAIGELLQQLEATWQGRCHDTGKDLVIENFLDRQMMLHTDVELVQQILGNLIDNACKYSRDAADPRIWLRADCQANRLVLEVEDCGPGVPLRERTSIFRPFRRGHKADVTAGGVGLGLALAQRWATLLGGNLTLCPSCERAGACFRVELPLIS